MLFALTRRPDTAARPLAALAALLLACLGVLFVLPTSGTAWAAACTCQAAQDPSSSPSAGDTASASGEASETPVARPVDKLLDRASTVVTGTISAIDDATDPAQFTVTLDRIYRGEIDTTSVTFAQDPKCPLKRLTVGERWVVAAREATGTDVVPVAIACNLSGPATATRLRAMERNFGTGSAPVRPTPPEPTLEKVETAGPERFLRLAAPGAAMFVIGLLGFLGVRRLGRTKN